MSKNLAIPATVVPSGVIIGPSGAAGGAGLAGLPGPRVLATLSADSGNTATLGSDSLLYVPAPVPASASASGLLRQVSGSTRDLIDGTNNSREIEVATSFRKRYYYCWHCDHPPSTNEVLAASGTGASVGPIAPTEAGHPGLYNLVTGTVGTGFAYYASSTVADIQLGFFTKLALRVVFKSVTNWSSFGRWIFGLTDSLNVFPPVNGIIWYYDAEMGRIYLNRYNAGVETSSGNLAFSINGVGGWTDWSIYWDSTGVKARGGIYNYVALTPPNLFGPYTTGLPATTTNLFLQININNTGDLLSSTLSVDFIEICGELAIPGGFRGEELVTNP